jgi:ZIP family zinc transporter
MLADAMMPEAYEHGGKLVGLLTVVGFIAAAGLSLLG